MEIMKKRKQAAGVGVILVLMAGTLAGCGSGSGRTASETTMGIAEETMGITAAAAETTAGSVQSDGEGMAAEAGMEQRYQQAYGGEFINSEEYHEIIENGFQNVAQNPLSTFSVDVDTASYGNVRRMINRGQEIPKDAVRIEEMINYFNYEYEEPDGEEPFAVHTELSDCPWNPDHQLLLIGLQAKKIDFDRRPMSNLVFLLDVSGSMYEEDKLPLVQKSFSMLTNELTENDRVSIVTYAGYDQVVLEGARGDEKEAIRAALESLTAGGSTAGEAGINRAYELAERYFIEGGNNRVILATDGDLNVGVSSEDGLKKLVEKKRKGGVHLSVLGFGEGNLKDNKMEALADNGDGNYNYIDSLKEAKKVLVEEMGGTLVTVAKDVKLQLEFNPVQVEGYRLIGYENRKLADEDFHDDTVDAGEIGAGHRVTALYEIVRANGKKSGLKYQEANEETREEKETDNEILTVNIRYKAPDGDESKLMSKAVETSVYQKEMAANLTFASAVAEFGMLIRDSEWKGSSSYEGILEQLSTLGDGQMDDYKDEFRELVLKMMER